MLTPLKKIYFLYFLIYSQAKVQSSYLRLMLQNRQECHLTVIDINQDVAPKNIFQNLAEIIKPYLSEGEYIDFILANASFGQQAIN
ncbi:enhanced serine sensitivity protein SseB C-terminal domain-containing protein [Gilliamella apicola]|uniref:enhanced serine sensitivity protein SseB C-terminal domain-containing protein n=1 Tax=Gilliamella apicola TaxID=1196095 RepID=UPI002FEE1411